MAKMVSPAGEVDFKMLKIGRDADKLVIIGEMGVWEATIYFKPKEVLSMAKLLISLSFIKYLVIFPYLFVLEILHSRKPRPEKEE